jgi:hypothetical protein
MVLTSSKSHEHMEGVKGFYFGLSRTTFINAKTILNIGVWILILTSEQGKFCFETTTVCCSWRGPDSLFFLILYFFQYSSRNFRNLQNNWEYSHVSRRIFRSRLILSSRSPNNTVQFIHLSPASSQLDIVVVQAWEQHFYESSTNGCRIKKLFFHVNSKKMLELIFLMLSMKSTAWFYRDLWFKCWIIIIIALFSNPCYSGSAPVVNP